MTLFIKRLAILALLTSLIPMAQAEQGEWYGTGSIIYNDDDAYRAIDDSLSGIQINVGRNMTEHLSLEGMLGYSDISAEDCAPGDCFPDQKHLDVSANLLAFYDRDSVVAPYLLMGVGYLGVNTDDDAIFNRDSGDNAPTASVGLGFKWRLGQSKFSIRAEHRARFVFDDKNLTDQLTTIGLQYSFGAKSRDIGLPDDKPADTDGDGVLDMWDACADTPAGVDVTARGCEIKNIDRDADNDRVPDSRDECPNTRAGAPVDQRGCSLDSDMDGIPTGQDRCPGTRPGVEVDAFGCAINPDRDGDRVLNDDDRCPSTPRGARVDVYGCEIKDVIQLPGVNFTSGSDLLLAGTEQLLKDAARTLNNYPNLQIQVAGHTDNVGNVDLNLGLSDRRAKTVLEHLVEYGVDPARLTFRGYGDIQPIADNSTAEGRAQNRRVELRIVSE